ncbi:Arf-GAP with Rho-GAP domain, ANK repeat and PH domain-containing protein 3, partial [Eumeta japonica]
EGVSGEWLGAWMLLVRRLLVYYTTHDANIKSVDLRKTRCVVTRDADDCAKSFCSAEGSPNLLLDCPHATLYLRFPHEKELKGWKYMIKLAAHNNGTYIYHQQLTKDNVPTIVEKCISFLYAYGSLTEGIYRRAGSSSILTELLARFRKDAWSVQLSPATHSEHDVAGVLKRFFRELPDPLIPQNYRAPLIKALKSLNKAWFSQEVVVVHDLISNYELVWEPSDAERRREAAVRRVLERVSSNNAAATPRSAGDLKAWVHVHDRTNCYQVALTPNKTSADLCFELAEKAGRDSHLLMVEEVICRESLRRIVHINEIVLDVVLRWSYWDEEDRKDNYLLVKENSILYKMVEMKSEISAISGELKYANETNKTFKQYLFEVSNAMLYYFKDKQRSQCCEEWNIKNIFWYVGNEPKRNPNTRWCVTFIPRNNKSNRSKDRPWFGSAIAGLKDDQMLWITALTFSEHDEILPTPRLIVT